MFEEKAAWRDKVRVASSGVIGTGPVALDIAIDTAFSLGGVLKPVIDGLETYLGRGTAGGREFRPLDERIVMLRVRRVPEAQVRLRLTAGIPSQALNVRVPPPMPILPAMDPDFTFSMSDMEHIERYQAWRRIFDEPVARTI
jgi:hypothetical protein